MASYQITAYPLAELPVPGWECFFARNDISFHTLIFYAWLITDGSKTILVDTGPPPDEENFSRLKAGCQGVDERSELRRVQALDNIFKQAGVTPAQIDFLLITQPITYNCGCLLPRYFPKAKVYISWQGMMEFLLESPGHPPRDLYFTEASWAFMWQLLIQNRLFLVDGPTEVLPDLFFETTGGHHPGSAAVKVRTPDGIVSILETAFLKENIDKEIPIGVAEDVAACRAAIKRYKQESRLVLAAHDNTIPDRYEGGRIQIDHRQ